MSIFLSHSDRVLVQGMTGSEGQKHTRRMLSAGTKVVGGVNPARLAPALTLKLAPLGRAAAKLRPVRYRFRFTAL